MIPIPIAGTRLVECIGESGTRSECFKPSKTSDFAP
jgi:hypothetical protein